MKKIILFTLIVASLSIGVTSSEAEAPAPVVVIKPTVRELIKEFSIKYNTDETILLSAGICESHLNQSVKGADGEIGMYQFLPSTWKRLSKEMGEELDINSPHDQIKLTAWSFSNNHGGEWTTYQALQNGGTKVFYSKRLAKHFTVNCKKTT